ncbi:YlxR-like protein [Gracilaria domingensis]|nr:YlxR-like protein [Gracilaria domingensis]
MSSQLLSFPDGPQMSCEGTNRAAFLSPICRIPGPRQGRNVRMCVVVRERLPRTLLWQVVRVKTGDGRYVVKLGEGNGRSAYISKDYHSVTEGLKRKRLSKALRCPVPKHIGEELEKLARTWDSSPLCQRGLVYAEVYGTDGTCSALDEVQGPCQFTLDPF